MLPTAILLLALAAPGRAAPAFIQEPGVRLTSAVLQGAVNIPPSANNPLKIADNGDAAGHTRFYYIRGSTAVYSAVTTDGGQTFVDENHIQLSSATEPRVDITSITGLSILPLTPVPNGGYRMLYAAVSTSAAGDVYRIFSATSADGLNWANDTGTRVDGGASFTGSPSLVKLGTGDWRLYYIQNVGAASAANRRVFSALSINQGRDFAAGSQLSTPSGQAGDVTAMKRTDGSVRLLYTAPLTGETTNSTVISALTESWDTNGTVFALESGVRLASAPSSSGFISNPFVVRSTDSWRWKLYYNYTLFGAGVSTASVYSASSYAPDPVSMSPPTVLRTATDITFDIKGDCFSSNPPGLPTFKIDQGGAGSTDQTGATTWTDDQNVKVTFNVQGKALGWWTLTATNGNNHTGTLTNALYIDYAPGKVTLTDNLMRPRSGTPTTIEVQTFNAGHLTVKLYTMTGELVKTLYDGQAPEGATTLTWDGKTGLGHTVASGVYIVRSLGEKVDKTNKIVVIK